MSRYFIGFVVILAACFGLQSFLLRASGGKTLKSESNYFSSIARIQTETQGSPRIMLLGSSMTGRLGDRARRVDGVANLGCDGGSAVITLRAMDRGRLPTAPLLIIEANSLAFELHGQGREIGHAIDSKWFEIGIKTPNLGATARPTAFAYSWLVAHSAGGAANFAKDHLPLESEPEMLDTGLQPTLTPQAEALVSELAGIFERLRKKGSDILIVMLPPGVKDDSLAKAIAAKSGVRWWDLNAGLSKDAVGFSDGLHLDSPSAQKVMLTLLREVKMP
jgi:hypothetical protein